MKSTHVSAAAVDVAAKYMLEILTEKAKKKKKTQIKRKKKIQPKL